MYLAASTCMHWGDCKSVYAYRYTTDTVTAVAAGIAGLAMGIVTELPISGKAG